MDSQDQRSAVERLVVVLRKCTRAVRSIPFIYLAFFSLYMISFSFIPEWMYGVVDSFSAGNPLMVVFFLCSSRILKLCNWHKVACLIPSSTRIEGYIDSCLFTFTQNELIAIHLVIGVLTGVFLLLAFRKFFLNGRKGNHKAGA